MSERDLASVSFFIFRHFLKHIQNTGVVYKIHTRVFYMETVWNNQWIGLVVFFLWVVFLNLIEVSRTYTVNLAIE